MTQLIQKWEERKLQEEAEKLQLQQQQQQCASSQPVSAQHHYHPRSTLSPSVQHSHSSPPIAPKAVRSSSFYRLPALRPNVGDYRPPSMQTLPKNCVPAQNAQNYPVPQRSLSPTSTASTCSSSTNEEPEFVAQQRLPPISHMQLPKLPPIHLPSLSLSNSPPTSSSRYSSYSSPRSSPRLVGSPRIHPSSHISPYPSPRTSSQPINNPSNHQKNSCLPDPSELEKIPPPPISSAPSYHQATPPPQMQQQLPTQAKLFESVFQFSPVPMAIITVNGLFVACNNLFSELLGYQSDEMLKHQPVSYFTRGNANFMFNDQLMQSILQYTAQQQQSKVPISFARRDGSTVETVQTLGVIRDMFGNGSFFVTSIIQHRIL